MKLFVTRVVLFLAIFSLAAGIMFFVTGNLAAINGRMGVTIDKHQRLESIRSPKIILVGGSNLHYGINSKLLEDSLGMPVVNMALQGSIGLRYMFEEIKNNISPKDYIILAPEDSHFNNVDIDGESSLIRLISAYPTGIKYLNFNQCLSIIPNMGISISGNLMEIRDYFLFKMRGWKQYRQRSNSYGDYTWHKDKASVYKPERRDYYTGNVSNEAILLIKDFQKSVTERKATFLLTCSPISKTESDSMFLNKIAISTKEFNLISNFNQYIFPDDFFFDTGYHLLFDKQNLRTLMLIEDFKNNLNSIEK